MRLRWVALVALALVAIWALRPASEFYFLDKTEILIDQLLGRGCQFQDPLEGTHSLNPLTTFSIRHPELVCPMWAAGHLTATPPAARARVVAAIDEALRRHPAVFDTGDGLLHYAAALQSARESILRSPSPQIEEPQHRGRTP